MTFTGTKAEIQQFLFKLDRKGGRNERKMEIYTKYR